MKQIRINLAIPVKNEIKQDQQDVQKHVADDRKLHIQAAIVRYVRLVKMGDSISKLDRIMKARQTLKHELLVQEVITTVKGRFSPAVPDIKKVCIIAIHS